MKAKFFLQPLKSIGYVLGLTILTGFNIGVLAQSSPLQFNPPTPPEQGSPTGRQRGGGTRGQCYDYQELTALIPETDGVVLSHTVSANPNFFFYIPHSLEQTTLIEFVVQDRNDNYVFQQEFSTDADVGILNVALVLEGNHAGLSLGQSYSWTLSIYCDVVRPSDSVSVTGMIRRVAGSTVLMPEPMTLSPEATVELIRQYAAEGIWHEAFELAIELYQTEPDVPEYLNLVEVLLSQAGLSDIVPTVPVFSSRDS